MKKDLRLKKFSISEEVKKGQKEKIMQGWLPITYSKDYSVILNVEARSHGRNTSELCTAIAITIAIAPRGSGIKRKMLNKALL
ncbi:MAG: hypothetical protein Q7S47_00610 [bacterium]|nr:hypothetical protein [bacterium]